MDVIKKPDLIALKEKYKDATETVSIGGDFSSI